MRLGIEPRAVHVGERRGEDDAARVMRLGVVPGATLKSGNADSATLMRSEPEPLR